MYNDMQDKPDDIDPDKINPDRIILATDDEEAFQKQLEKMEEGELCIILQPHEVDEWNRGNL
jgi:hypothetical protein